MPIDSYCLWCGRSLKYDSTLRAMFYIDDVLCEKCRQSIIRKPKKIRIDNITVEGLYVYDGLYREMLIQYKELYDEALFPAFLWKDKKRLEKKYHGYTIVPIPSSTTRNKERGFKTVDKIFSILDLPLCDLLEKTGEHEQKKVKGYERKLVSQHLVLKSDVEVPEKVLLVDDIVTTGETVRASYNLLKGKVKDIKIFTCAYNKAFLRDGFIYNKRT